jgi:hypothetical protein
MAAPMFRINYESFVSDSIRIVTYRVVHDLQAGFGLDDWVYRHLIHSIRDYRKHSAIADLHTLQFTVTHALGFSAFTSLILATDL